MCGDSLGKNIQILFLLAGIDLARLEGVTDGSRKTMTVRATTANAAERMVKERYPVSYRETESIQIKNK